MFRRRKHPSVTTGATYTEWVTFLDAFAKGDLSALPVSEPLPEAIGDQAALRLSNRAIQAVEDRLKLWSSQLERNLSHHRSVAEFERTLARSREHVATVWSFVQTAHLPGPTCEHLQKMVKEQIEKTQDNLERQFDGDMHARSDYGSAVRRASLRAVLQGTVVATQDRFDESTGTNQRSRRQIIIDKQEG